VRFTGALRALGGRRCACGALLCFLVAFAAACTEDFAVNPTQPQLDFTMARAETTLAIGDTVFPGVFGPRITLQDRGPVDVAFRFVEVPGSSALVIDSGRALLVRDSGYAPVTIVPYSSALPSDTLARLVRVRGIVYAATITPSPPRTLDAIGDTLRCTGVPLTRDGVALVAQVRFRWRSSDTSKVKVDGTGKVTAVANGTATITATVDSAWGTATASVSVTVQQLPTQLGFVRQPPTASAGARLDTVKVAVQDRLGTTVSTDTRSVTVAIASGTGKSGANLRGTRVAAAVAGVATFGSLSIDSVGTSYQLSATGAPLTGGTSSAFDINPAPAAKLGFSGQPGSATAGVSLGTVRVAVQDSLGNTVTTATNSITVAITAGTGKAGANLRGTKTVSAVAGVATFSGLSIDSVGTAYTLTATATGLTSAASTTFTITVAPAVKLGYSVQPRDTVAGVVLASPTGVRVAVQDSLGNTVTTVAATSVTVAIASGTGKTGANLRGPKTLSTSSGVVSFTGLSIDSAASGYRLAATATGLTSTTSNSFSITTAPGLIVFTQQPTNQTAGVPFSPAVAVAIRDSLGNTVTIATSSITVAITAGTGKAGANLRGTKTVSAVAGVATFSGLSIDSVGTNYTLTGTATGLTSAASTTFNITVAPASRLRWLVQPSNTTAGVTINPAPQLAVEDSLGNRVTTATTSITVAITSGTGTAGANLRGTKTASAVAGVVTFSGLSIDSVGTNYTLTGTATGLTSGTSAAFTITVAPPVRLGYSVPPRDTVAGVVLRSGTGVKVAIQDSLGNTVTTAASTSVTVAIASGTGTAGANLRGTKTVSTSSGVATFSTLSIDSAGSGYRLTATATGYTSGSSGTFAISPAPASKLGFTVQPRDTVAGVPLASPTGVRVAVQDSLGNTVTTVAATSVTVAIASGTGKTGANLRGTKTLSTSSGVVSFTGLSIDSAGTAYRLTASATALTSATSTTFAITVAPATRLGYLVEPSNQAQNSAIAPPINVAVQDSLGNTVATATNSITITIGTNPPGNGVLSGTTTQTAVSGVATFSDVRIDKVGTGYTLVASASGLASGTSTTFNITVAVVSTLLGPISAGREHACAVATGGAVSCWGGNGQGQLGDGSFTDRSAPVTVSGGLTFASVSAGYLHTCGATTTGAAYCWGYNAYGQLGNNSTTNSSSPALVAGGLTFTSVSAGGLHACGLTTGGAVYCWGYNAYGQLGNNSTTQSSSPVLVSGGLTFSAVSVGFYHSCGLTTSGAAYCWGLGSSGQLGNNAFSSSSVPAAVSGVLAFRSITLGESHSCGLTPSDVAYCWGLGSSGQLGNNLTTQSSSPVLVSGGLTFASLNAHLAISTCGVTPSGSVYCWGYNIYGQIGDGSTSSRLAPVAVLGGVTFAAASPGSYHTCALDTSGAAYCWGYGANGRLGNNSTTALTAPTPVGGGLALTTVSAGESHGCGLTSAGAAYCWGYNAFGQLGNNSTSQSTTPVAVSGSLTFQSIRVGYYYTCGVTTGGAAYCWGAGANGQLGNGGTGNVSTPSLVSASGITFASVSAGRLHTCAVTTGGAAYCWGQGDQGQLGNGLTGSSTVPLLVSGGLTLSAVSTSGGSVTSAHTCGRTTGGAVYCWGRNVEAQLGDGSTTQRDAPVQVSSGLSFTSVNAGNTHTCAVTTTGAAYCWGANSSGQLGNGGTVTSTTPSLVSGGLTFASVSAGTAHTCGVTTGSVTYCWGRNSSGELGDLTVSQRTSPTAVSAGSLTFQSVSAAEVTSCARTAAGAAYCWGQYANGRLGNGSTVGSTAPVPVAGGLTFQKITGFGAAVRAFE
jgi:alpha-tubulin suppressor-like RCC1 family protein